MDMTMIMQRKMMQFSKQVQTVVGDRKAKICIIQEAAPNWPFLLQPVLMLEFLKKDCCSNFNIFGQWPCSKHRDLGNMKWSLYCIVLEKGRNFVNPWWDFFLRVRRGGWVEFWQILTQHIRGGAGQGILTRDKEVSWKILLAKPPHKYCRYWLL